MWRIVGNLFQAWQPELYQVYAEAARLNFPKDLPPGVDALPFDVFAMLVHNWFEENSGSDWHIDLNDFRNGYCAVVCYGKFSGGEVIFPELGIALKLEPGDVLFFKSSQLTHGNAPVVGLRRSVVLTTHNNVIYSHEHWIDDGSVESDDE